MENRREEKKPTLFVIKSKGLLLALQLWWAESYSPHLDPVKHFLQTHIRSDFHPTIALRSICEWVCEAPESEDFLCTRLSGTVRELQALGITFTVLFGLLLCAQGKNWGRRGFLKTYHNHESVRSALLYVGVWFFFQNIFTK